MRKGLKILFGLIGGVVFSLALSGKVSAYSFSTSVSSTLNADSIIYGGTTVGANFAVNISGGATPDKTRVQYAYFLIRDNVQLSDMIYTHNAGGWSFAEYRSLHEVLSENTNFWRVEAAQTSPTYWSGYKHAKFGICEYFWEMTGGAYTAGYGELWGNAWTSRGGNSILAECHTGELREPNEIPLGVASASGNYAKTVSIEVPDVKAGYKLCVAAGINYADGGVADSGQYRWHISGASCSTIAKKPNFQAWNGGMYAPEGVVSSSTYKTANAGRTNGVVAGAMFGSWGQYYVVASGDVAGFSSASGLGYGSGSGFGKMNTTGTLAGTIAGESYYCQISRLSIGNFECKGETKAGNYGGTNLNISDFVDELKAKYSEGAAGVEYHEGDVALNTITDVVGTRVIRATGTVYINGDICVWANYSGSGSCWAGGSNKQNYLGLATDYNAGYSSAVDIPQVLIIARDIVIAPDVTQVDAWLVTDEGGSVSTCGAGGVYNSATCWKTLKVNGPVYTSRLTLNRTGGAWPGLYGDIGNPNEGLRHYYGGDAREARTVWRDLTCDGSISPAEIFDLHPAAVMWAFYQANTLSRAYVVNMQEFSPRY